MQRYVIVLAASVQEGVTYARRKGLPARGYRSPARAASLRGIRNAEVHRLPTFRGRRDAHAILAELRYGNFDFIDVEMPEPLDEPTDQGDGMGEQLDILEEVRTKALEDFARSELIGKEQNGATPAAPVESEDPAPAPKAKPRKPRSKPAPIVAGMFD